MAGYAIIDVPDVVVGFIDSIGHFPQRSSKGNKYLLISYHYNTNHIHVIPVKNRKGATITEVQKELYKVFSKAGISPNTYILGNETYGNLLNAFDVQNTKHQLVLLCKYRNNYIERAIQTFKEHPEAGLASINLKFALSEQNRLIL